MSTPPSTAPAGAGQPTVDQLGRAAVTVLIQNWRGHATVPSRSLYPHQWSWDSAFIALGLQHWAPRRAASELLSMFGAQWADGRVPHIAFNPAVPEDAYFPGPAFWRSHDVRGPSTGRDLRDHPTPGARVAAAEVIDRLGEPVKDSPHGSTRSWSPRTPTSDGRRAVSPAGLAVMLHPWETGMDNSPAWDEPLAAVPADLSLLDVHTRRDLDHAGYSERPTDHDYARYIRLAATYRDHGYDDVWAAAEAEFAVVDPGFNALWAWSELALAEIAEQIGRDRTAHLDEAARITAALAEELFWTRSERRPGLLPRHRSPHPNADATRSVSTARSRSCCRACPRRSSSGSSTR